MNWPIVKYLLTARVLVAVSEAAKRSDTLGGFMRPLGIQLLP